MTRGIDKVIKALTSVLFWYGIIFMSIGTLLAFVGTIARYIFGTSFEWMEELIRLCMLSAAFVMAGPLMMRGGDIALTVVVDAIKDPKIKGIIDIIDTVVIGVFSALLAKWSFSCFLAVKGQVTYSHIFPKQLPYAIVPIGMAILCLYCILKLVQKGLHKRDSGEAGPSADAS